MINETPAPFARATNHTTTIKVRPIKNPNARSAASLVPNKLVKRRIVIGKRIGNDVNFKLWSTSGNVGSRASSTESHSSRQSAPAWVARTTKTKSTVAESRTATIHSAALIIFELTIAADCGAQKAFSRV